MNRSAMTRRRASFVVFAAITAFTAIITTITTITIMITPTIALALKLGDNALTFSNRSPKKHSSLDPRSGMDERFVPSSSFISRHGFATANTNTTDNNTDTFSPWINVFRAQQQLSMMEQLALVTAHNGVRAPEFARDALREIVTARDYPPLASSLGCHTDFTFPSFSPRAVHSRHYPDTDTIINKKHVKKNMIKNENETDDEHGNGNGNGCDDGDDQFPRKTTEESSV
jgi:hypothetical protein